MTNLPPTREPEEARDGRPLLRLRGRGAGPGRRPAGRGEELLLDEDATGGASHGLLCHQSQVTWLVQAEMCYKV